MQYLVGTVKSLAFLLMERRWKILSKARSSPDLNLSKGCLLWSENTIRGKSRGREAGQKDAVWLTVVVVKMVGFWIDFKGKAERVCGQIRCGLGEKGSRNDSKVLV